MVPIPKHIMEQLVGQSIDRWVGANRGASDPRSIPLPDVNAKKDLWQYLPADAVENWSSLSPDDREQLLRSGVATASRDDDLSGLEKFTRVGGTLAGAAAALGLGAQVLPMLTGAGAGAGAGGKGALGLVAGGEGTAAGTASEILGTASKFGKFGGKIKDWFTKEDGGPAWGRIAGAGAGALGLLGGMGGRGGGGSSPPGLPHGWNDPLQPMEFDRTQNAMPESDYYTYGQSGGEHQFFTNNQIPQAAEEDPEGTMRGFIGTGPGGARFNDGGSARGSGSGRDDTIKALLSDGEYVIDAETVALLGDGSVDEGAERLDQMRRNLRRHKGQALAKGKFTPPAKAPDQYLRGGRAGYAKGGRIRGDWVRRVIPGGTDESGLHKLTDQERIARLRAFRRAAEAYREQQEKMQKPIGKAKGGKVKAIGKRSLAELRALAEELAATLQFSREGRAPSIMPERRSPASQYARELERLKPDSEALRWYKAKVNRDFKE